MPCSLMLLMCVTFIHGNIPPLPDGSYPIRLQSIKRPSTGFGEDRKRGDIKNVKETELVYEQYCQFQNNIDSVADDTPYTKLPCKNGCEWWEDFIGDKQIVSMPTCAFKSVCDILRSHSATHIAIGSRCRPIKGYIMASPVLHRPSAIYEHDLCKCASEQSSNSNFGESCSNAHSAGSDDSDFYWCFTEPESSYCLHSRPSNNLNKFPNTRYASTGRTCVGFSNQAEAENNLLDTWEIGTHPDQIFRETALHVMTKRFRFSEEFEPLISSSELAICKECIDTKKDTGAAILTFLFGEQMHDHDVCENEDALCFTGVHERRVHKDRVLHQILEIKQGLCNRRIKNEQVMSKSNFDRLMGSLGLGLFSFAGNLIGPLASGYYEITDNENIQQKANVLHNVFGMHYPMCFDFQAKNKGGCISHTEWLEGVLSSMSNNNVGDNSDDRRRLVSNTKIRFTVPNQGYMKFFDDEFCTGREYHTLREWYEVDAELVDVDSILETHRVRPDHEHIGFRGKSWIFVLYGDKRCVSATNDCNNGDTSECHKNKKCLSVVENHADERVPFVCVKSDAPEVTFIDKDTNMCDGLLKVSRWKQCDENQHVDPDDVHQCQWCPKTEPSRPYGNPGPCKKCPLGQYFISWGTRSSQCVGIPQLVWSIQDGTGGTSASTKWRFETIQPVLDESRYDETVTRNDGVKIYYEDTDDFEYRYIGDDQTELLTLEKDSFIKQINNINRSTPCADKHDNANYIYRVACGFPGSPFKLDEYDPFFLGMDMKKKSALSNGNHHILLGGIYEDCEPCDGNQAEADGDQYKSEGQYNDKCWSSQTKHTSSDACKPCTSSEDCQSTQFLDHNYTSQGCRNVKAVTDTFCTKCPLVRGHAQGPETFNIVVGCGTSDLKRWDGKTGHVGGDSDTFVTCVYKDTAAGDNEYQGIDRECLHQRMEILRSNNYDRGFTRGDVHDIPYCPPRYKIKESCSKESLEINWRSECCELCKLCPVHQMKGAGYQICAGNSKTDTQSSQCTDMCPTGHFKDVSDTSDLKCARCKTSCSS